MYPLFCRVSHCHCNNSSLRLVSTQWQPGCTAFLLSIVVSVYQNKHSCSAEMATSCFNYPSRQLRWKDTAPDKARPHSFILQRLFSHRQMQRRPSANSRMKPRDGCCPKHRANCTALSYWMTLTPHKWGLFYPDNCPWFSQAPGICTSMAARSCMNNISVKWLGSYLSQWLNFALQVLQGDFICCLNCTGSEGECHEIPERRQWHAEMNVPLSSFEMNVHAVKPGHATSRTCPGTLVGEPSQQFQSWQKVETLNAAFKELIHLSVVSLVLNSTFHSSLYDIWSWVDERVRMFSRHTSNSQQHYCKSVRTW